MSDKSLLNDAVAVMEHMARLGVIDQGIRYSGINDEGTRITLSVSPPDGMSLAEYIDTSLRETANKLGIPDIYIDALKGVAPNTDETYTLHIPSDMMQQGIEEASKAYIGESASGFMEGTLKTVLNFLPIKGLSSAGRAAQNNTADKVHLNEDQESKARISEAITSTPTKTLRQALDIEEATPTFVKKLFEAGKRVVKIGEFIFGGGLGGEYFKELTSEDERKYELHASATPPPTDTIETPSSKTTVASAYDVDPGDPFDHGLHTQGAPQNREANAIA